MILHRSNIVGASHAIGFKLTLDRLHRGEKRPL
jgi:hypothetical protein